MVPCATAMSRTARERVEHVLALLLGLQLAGEADRLLERAVARRLRR